VQNNFTYNHGRVKYEGKAQVDTYGV